ncbi:MAG: zinc ribbon domain-containing protein [Chloroflexi bacterium]|nr:zinc ribbon domain-containing protein [Chloroflexota bacterium]
MPTYQYRCTSCSSTLERWQGFSEEPLTECPSCGGSLRRVFSPVGLIFKGAGWYCTDSRPKTPEVGESCTAAEPTSKCGSCTKESTCAATK